eukprot:TRINITY_DN2827_c0_g2_i1.p1 TRINITY_DN2827_c0_g2~~TRINITY_DN2827_c0_g2_i1.p1  ORF type:complete len:730 (+),score=152.31 TRINITY_DN2827_c0_g2_i1:119-2191(+)
MSQEVLTCIGGWEVLKPTTELGQPTYRKQGTAEITDVKPKAVEMLEQDEGTWEQVKTANGIIKRHLVTHSVKQPPSEKLPEGWVQRQSPDGRVFYKNLTTNEKTWSKPKGQPPPQQLSQQPPPHQNTNSIVDSSFGNLREQSASPELVASPDSLMLGSRVAKMSPLLGAKSQLPEESPSRNTVPAFVNSTAPNVDSYLTQIELISAERNIESDLRKQQEAKNKELQELILQQQQKLAQMEQRTRTLAANQSSSKRHSDRGYKNARISLPPSPTSRQGSMSPHQALAVAHDICDNSGINGIIQTPGSNPREMASQLLSTYVRQYGNPNQQQVRPTTAKKKSKRSPAAAPKAADNEMVLNLNISDENGTLQAVPANNSDHVVGVSLNVYHDKNGELLGVHPSSQGMPAHLQGLSSSHGMGRAPKRAKHRRPSDRQFGGTQTEHILREELESQRTVIETQQTQLINLQKQILSMMNNESNKPAQPLIKTPNESTEQIVSHKVFAPQLDLATFDPLERGSAASSNNSFQQPQQQQQQQPQPQQQQQQQPPDELVGSKSVERPQPGMVQSPLTAAGSFSSKRTDNRPTTIGGPAAPPPFDPSADPREMCPISEFRQYEMADTLARLQTLAETRPAQGVPPVMVSLPNYSPNLQQHPAEVLPDSFYTQQSAGIGASSRVPQAGEYSVRPRKNSIAL